MIKKLSLMVLFVLVLSINIFAADLSVDVTNVSPSSVSPGEAVTLTLELINAGADPIAPIRIDTSDADAVAGGPDLVLPNTLASDESLGASETKTITVTFEVPNNAPAGDYTATLTAVETDDATETDSDTYTFNVASEPVLTIKQGDTDVSDELSVNVESGEDEDNDLVLTLTNDGNVDLNNLRLSADFSDLEDNDGDNIVISDPSEIANLDVGDSVDIEFNFDVDSGFDAETLTGSLVIESDELDDEITFRLQVSPVACSPNSDDGDLQIDTNDIEEDLEDEEFSIGDEIRLRFEVENSGDDDMDVRIEAVLYNTDKDRRVDSQTLTRNIDEDETADIDFNLQLDDNLDDDDEHVLFLKVFDDDNQDETCLVEEFDIDIDVPENQVLITDPTLLPMSASCGERVSGSALLRNVGQDDETVSFEVYNTQLSLSQSVQSVSLDRDDEQAVNFAFNLPNNAQAGVYPIYFKARYSGEETLVSEQLTVTQCQGSSQGSSSSNSGSQSSSSGQSSFQQALPPVPQYATGQVALEEKDLFEKFNTPGFKVPTLVWVLIDVLLVVLILSCLVWLFRSR